MGLKRIEFICIVVAVAGMNLPLSLSATDGPDERNVALAEQVAELQRTRDFHQAEWDLQMRMMQEHMPDGEDFGFPDEYLEMLREQQVDGQTEEWIRALAESLDPARLEAHIRFLQQPEAEAWVDDQLAVYPEFLDGMMMRAMAIGEVMMEDVETMMDESNDFGFEQVEEISLVEIEPVTGSALAEVFEMTPGSRIEAGLDTNYYRTERVPASHSAVQAAFADLEIQLMPDGNDHARVMAISAERAYPSEEACENVRGDLELALAEFFDDTETNPCGDARYLSEGGDTRMSLTCRKQKAVGASRLRLSVRHLPTEEANRSRFGSWIMADETELAPEAGVEVQ